MNLKDKIASLDAMCREFAQEADRYEQLHGELLVSVKEFILFMHQQEDQGNRSAFNKIRQGVPFLKLQALIEQSETLDGQD
jgi:hypothetical protein